MIGWVQPAHTGTVATVEEIQEASVGAGVRDLNTEHNSITQESPLVYMF